MIDDNDTDGAPSSAPAWCNPTRAKDMLHGTALFVRDMLTHDHAALFETYGIRPDEAAQSLQFVELAVLRAWGVEEMFEAAAGVPNQASSDAALRRRIAMAMMVEATGDLIHPGEAVLLLERSGLMLSHELREAVVFMSAGSYVTSGDFADEDENRLRRLLGRPAPSDTQTRDCGTGDASSDVPSARNSWDVERMRRLQFEFNEPGMTQGKLAERHNVSRQMIGKMLIKAREQLGPAKPTPFDSLGTRNRK
jgi:hypothetical protein